jgi:HTH-type transcriptional regulator / antitoxin HigA
MNAQIMPSYLKLVRKFPLHVIRSETQYDAAIEMIQSLAIRGENAFNRGEADYLDALSSLVESYEAAHHPIGPDGLLPHERLKWLAKESKLSPAKLAKLLDVSQPLASMILSGKRELTVSHIRSLSEYFHLSPRYFIKAKRFRDDWFRTGIARIAGSHHAAIGL